jgi:hypothetical protein
VAQAPGTSADELGHVEREIRECLGGNALASREDAHVTVAVTPRLAVELELRGRQIDEPNFAHADAGVEWNLEAAVEPELVSATSMEQKQGQNARQITLSTGLQPPLQ